MNAQARNDYRTALKQAEAELANHEKRGDTLRNTIAGLKSLLGVERKAKAAAAPAPAPAKPARPKKKRKRRKSAGAGHPEVPAGTFKGMGPTFAYRKFVKIYGDGYTVPQIRDALVQGGVESKSRTSLLTGLHSVRRRDKLKAEAEARRKAAREAAAKSDDGGDS
jgi:hypothetical protein